MLLIMMHLGSMCSKTTTPTSCGMEVMWWLSCLVHHHMCVLWHVAYLELLGVNTTSRSVMTLHNDDSVSKGVQLASCS